MSMCIDFDILPGDLTRISSYGKTDDDNPVISDVGLNQSVWDEHYKPKRY